MDPTFIQRARDDVGEYQRQFTRDPGTGAVSVADSPYLLIPTGVIGTDLPAELRASIGPEAAADVMYRLGYLTARSQAKQFYEDRGIGLDEWEYRTVTGPFSAAWSGHGEAEMLVWEPDRGEDFLVLWESANSLAAREAIAAGVRLRACHLYAGYSAGWCSEATGEDLQTKEVACRAEGVGHCRFMIAHKKHVRSRMNDPRLHQPTSDYDVQHTRPF